MYRRFTGGKSPGRAAEARRMLRNSSYYPAAAMAPMSQTEARALSSSEVTMSRLFPALCFLRDGTKERGWGVLGDQRSQRRGVI